MPANRSTREKTEMGRARIAAGKLQMEEIQKAAAAATPELQQTVADVQQTVDSLLDAIDGMLDSPPAFGTQIGFARDTIKRVISGRSR